MHVHLPSQPTLRPLVRRLLACAALAVATGGVLAAPGPLSDAAGASSSQTVVTVTHNPTWGSILTLSNGDTVYRLTADTTNHSVCTSDCAQYWPPVVLTTGQKAPIGHGVRGLGTITLSNGSRQVTYRGIPLYLYVDDHHAGQVTGNIHDTWGQWWTVNPSHPLATPKASAKSGAKATTTTARSSGTAY